MEEAQARRQRLLAMRQQAGSAPTSAEVSSQLENPLAEEAKETDVKMAEDCRFSFYRELRVLNLMLYLVFCTNDPVGFMLFEDNVSPEAKRVSVLGERCPECVGAGNPGRSFLPVLLPLDLMGALVDTIKVRARQTEFVQKTGKVERARKGARKVVEKDMEAVKTLFIAKLLDLTKQFVQSNMCPTTKYSR
eukprot:gene1529-2159_t